MWESLFILFYFVLNSSSFINIWYSRNKYIYVYLCIFISLYIKTPYKQYYKNVSIVIYLFNLKLKQTTIKLLKKRQKAAKLAKFWVKLFNLLFFEFLNFDKLATMFSLFRRKTIYKSVFSSFPHPKKKFQIHTFFLSTYIQIGGLKRQAATSSILKIDK